MTWRFWLGMVVYTLAALGLIAELAWAEPSIPLSLLLQQRENYAVNAEQFRGARDALDVLIHTAESAATPSPAPTPK